MSTQTQQQIQDRYREARDYFDRNPERHNDIYSRRKYVAFIDIGSMYLKDYDDDGLALMRRVVKEHPEESIFIIDTTTQDRRKDVIIDCRLLLAISPTTADGNFNLSNILPEITAR